MAWLNHDAFWPILDTCDMNLKMKTNRIFNIKTALLALTQFAFMACASLPQTDPHSAVSQTIESTRGWRVEETHIGEAIPIPSPGKVTVLDFWSSSCEPCIKAMPELERIWQGVDQNVVQIIGVSIDTDDNLTRKTMAEEFSVQVTFPMIYDGKAARLQGAFRVGGTVPSTFVIDKQGNVRFYFDGSNGDMERLEQAVHALAKE